MLRFEAWTLPWSATFERVIVDIPVIAGTGRGVVKFNDFGEASIGVPAAYDRIDEIISDTVGTLIRVYDGSTIIQEFLAERVARNLEEDVANISGGDLATIFDRTIVYPFDYPTNQFPNHIYGGQNVLQNPGFEENGNSSTVYSLWLSATGGTFTMSDGTDTTSPIAYNAGPLALESALEDDIAAIDDISVTGDGVEDDPWIIEFVDPPFGITLTLQPGGLTGGGSHLNLDQTGALVPTGWQKAQAVSQGVVNAPYGAYDAFELDSTIVDSGVYSLKVDPAKAPKPGVTGITGAQQVATVKPGGLYQAGFRARPSSATTDIRLAVRGIDQDLIQLKTVNLSTGSFQDVAFNSGVTIPSDTSQVIYRMVITNTATNQPAVWFDNAYLAEGLPASNAGEILGDLLDDAAVDHASDPRGTPLDWISYSSFDDTNDSNGSAWSEDLSITLYAGMTYGQVLDKFTDLGYEWELVPKVTPSGGKTHNFKLYKPGGMGSDYTDGDANPAIIGGAGILGGPVVHRIPDYTAYLVAGDGVFAEGEDATATGNFGRFETYYGYKGLTTVASLTAVGVELLDREANNRVAVLVKTVRDGNHPTPLVDYKLADTLYFQLPPSLAKTGRRIHQVSWSNTNPATYDVVGSKLFPGQSGGWEALRKLIRRFSPFEDTPPPIASLGGSGGGMMTVAVAASDATDLSKSKADFVCISEDATIEILAAIDICYANGGGTIWLSEGTFFISSDQVIVGGSVGYPVPMMLRGLGEKVTVVRSDAGTDYSIYVATNSEVRDFTMDSPPGGD